MDLVVKVEQLVTSAARAAVPASDLKIFVIAGK